MNITEAWDDSVYLTPGIAKRLVNNKQSTPTPVSNIMSLAGEWIYDKHERLFDCIILLTKFGDSGVKDKAKNASKICLDRSTATVRLQS